MVLNRTLWPHLHEIETAGAEPHRPDAAEAGGDGRNRGALKATAEPDKVDGARRQLQGPGRRSSSEQD